MLNSDIKNAWIPKFLINSKGFYILENTKKIINTLKHYKVWCFGQNLVVLKLLQMQAQNIYSKTWLTGKWSHHVLVICTLFFFNLMTLSIDLRFFLSPAGMLLLICQKLHTSVYLLISLTTPLSQSTNKHILPN